MDACAHHWPHLFAKLADDEAERQRVRGAAHPWLVKGYEVKVMARLLLEVSSNVARIGNTATIISRPTRSGCTRQ